MVGVDDRIAVFAALPSGEARPEKTPRQPKAEALVRLLVEGNEAIVRRARSVFPVVEAHENLALTPPSAP